ncbi:MAG: nucleotide exchange factor GrpE [Rhodospirillales bacterium]|jgi:molecular chaperone GrpE|nr:nucleotide exchange factor GrpE [Rhodospirillales bacterium]
MSEEAKQDEPEGSAADEANVEAEENHAENNVENFPDAEREDAPEAAEEAPLTPEDRIAALDIEVTDLKDRLLRAVAETENVRRRAQRDKEDMAKYAITNFSRDMLSAADNLRRAIDSIDEETRKNDGTVENLLIGVEMTERGLLAAFERTGIKRMEPLGQKFDPNFHEAMFEYEDATKPAGSVGQVIEAGYMLHARALRPAKVGIAKGGPKFDAAAPVEAAESEAPADSTGYEKSAEGPGGTINEEL